MLSYWGVCWNWVVVTQSHCVNLGWRDSLRDYEIFDTVEVWSLILDQINCNILLAFNRSILLNCMTNIPVRRYRPTHARYFCSPQHFLMLQKWREAGLIVICTSSLFYCKHSFVNAQRKQQWKLECYKKRKERKTRTGEKWHMTCFFFPRAVNNKFLQISQQR